MHRANRFLFTLYLVLSLGLTVSAVVSPKTRAQAPAPLRDWVMDTALPAILPAPEPVVVSVLYSTEKQDWLTDVVARFEATRPSVNGHPIKLTMKMMGSREMYLAVLDGAEKPDLISPASSLQISILQDLSRKKLGNSVVNLADKTACRPVVTTPLVLVAWRERATVLWGDAPGGDAWRQLHDALVNPKGWEAFGRPQWGYVKFGHTSPLKSNSGFMTILLMTYSYFGKTSGLTSADILSDAGYQRWLKELEGTITELGDSTGTYMKEFVAYGPSKYDLVAVYESTAIEQMDNAVGRYGELRVYYPPATVLSDHPFCVLSADWVKPAEAQAAQKFVDYLASPSAQELALIKYGFRPVEPAVALDRSGSPFSRYKDNGLNVSLPPQVQVPPGDVLNTLLDFWSRTAQR